MTRIIAPHIKAVLFDHDDTLVATREAKWEQHRHIARTYYGKELTDEELHRHWGKPMRTLVGLLYGTVDIERALLLTTRVHHNFPKQLYEDTLGTLGQLRMSGKKIGLISAILDVQLAEDLEHLGIPSELFDYTQTSDATPFHKPDPRVFEPALKWLEGQGITPAETVYVGDGLHDMKAALAAGFAFIGVGTGLVTPEEWDQHGVPAVQRLADLVEL
jgi:phosphoglycolate phosphatase-like HAD superfamily hydrolase